MKRWRRWRDKRSTERLHDAAARLYLEGKCPDWLLLAIMAPPRQGEAHAGPHGSDERPRRGRMGK